MIDQFYNLSFPIHKNRLVNKALFAWNNSLRNIMRASYLPYCRKHPVTSGIRRQEGSEHIVVSMTTFPRRLDTIEPAIQSILRQTVKPDRILVWLTKEEVPDQKVPPELEKFQSAGVEVCFADINLKPHNKSFHTARLFPDSYIITVDDDIIYPEYLIEQLFETYRQYDKKTVVCTMAHEITLGPDGLPKGYKEWNSESIGIKGPSDLLMAKGVSGVLYPPGFFSGDYFDVETIQETCLMADDLWLKFIEILHGYKVVKTRARAKTVYEASSSIQNFTLRNANVGEDRNTLYLRKLIAKYPTIDWKSLQ